MTDNQPKNKSLGAMFTDVLRPGRRKAEPGGVLENTDLCGGEHEILSFW